LVPGHRRLDGNEIADHLARLGTECPFIGPEPSYDISAGVAKKAVKDWTFRDHKKMVGVHNGTQLCRGFPTVTLCQKNWGTTERK
jgi:hypothetical protein